MALSNTPRTSLSSEKAQTDYTLVQQAVKGDQQAYSQLMIRYREAIFHTVFKMVHSREDADDLTLEAFGKAFRKLESYTPDYAFSTWLFKIAINNTIDFIRKRRLRLLSIDEPVEDNSKQDYSNNLKANSLNPEETYIQQQRIHLMRKAMTKLSPKYRLMIELRFFEELSYQEIANELDIPLGTVKAQLFRAKELLQGILSTAKSAHIF